MQARQIASLLSVAALIAPAHAGPVKLPTGGEIRAVDFERHVAAVFAKMGCNAGACHGSFQGKGGFRLSLFNHDPRGDYLAVTRDSLGRRVNAGAPEKSLLLQKPAGQVAHEGGRRFAIDSWQYRVLREWIASGGKWRPGSGAVKNMEVRPAEHLFRKPGETVRLQVLVEYADGTKTDVAPFCTFQPRDEAVVEVSPDGVLRALRPGDTAVIVSYLGHLRTARAYVPVPAAEGFQYPRVPEVNYIDREVFAKLRRLNVVPAELCDDATFLRRVTIDTVGCLPSPEAVRAFLRDTHPLKRRRKIDELLAHPMHAALWATRFCDITGANVDEMEEPASLRSKRAWMWHAWFRKRIADNVPYDEIVRGVLCATSRPGVPACPRAGTPVCRRGADALEWIKREVTLREAMEKGFTTGYASRKGLDLFWRRTGPGVALFPLEQMAERTAAAFLGVRLECARCHKHPFDRWSQEDYRAYANVFAQVRFDTSPEVRSAVQTILERQRKGGAAALNRALPRVREVYVGRPTRTLAHPATGEALPPRALGGPELDYDGDARDDLFRWMARPDNPYFARNLVNRVWAHYFGRGLVEPADNFSVANPPSNERLLDALAKHFVESGYDIRRLERTILLSRTYQLSAVPNESNAHDRHNFARAYPRRMMAEAVVDVLNAALGASEDFGPDAPPGSRAIEIATNRVRDADLARIFRLFGRPERKAACDCERSAEPALPQTLFLMTDANLLRKIKKGRLKKLLASGMSDRQVFEELVLATLSRFPDERERGWAAEHLKAKKDRESAFIDIVWALINTREFILNH